MARKVTVRLVADWRPYLGAMRDAAIKLRGGYTDGEYAKAMIAEHREALRRQCIQVGA